MVHAALTGVRSRLGHLLHSHNLLFYKQINDKATSHCLNPHCHCLFRYVRSRCSVSGREDSSISLKACTMTGVATFQLDARSNTSTWKTFSNCTLVLVNVNLYIQLRDINDPTTCPVNFYLLVRIGDVFTLFNIHKVNFTFRYASSNKQSMCQHQKPKGY